MAGLLLPELWRDTASCAEFGVASHPSYDGASLHMEDCRAEAGDGANATNCFEHNCRFSSLSDQLFFLSNGTAQLLLAWTNTTAHLAPHTAQGAAERSTQLGWLAGPGGSSGPRYSCTVLT